MAVAESVGSLLEWKDESEVFWISKCIFDQQFVK